MNNEVLYVGGLCVLSFITGRLMVSQKESADQLSQPLFVLVALGCINYVALYEHWLLAGSMVLVTYFFGFAGKDSLKPIWRLQVKPKTKQTVGAWQQANPTKKEDDHSDIGI